MLFTCAFGILTPQKSGTKSYPLGLTKAIDGYYYADFKIGGQPLKALFDTGSSGIEVVGVGCNGTCSGQIGYDGSKSDKFVKGDSYFNGPFDGDGINPNISGFHGTDDMEIAGLSLKNETFGIWEQASGIPNTVTGILGWDQIISSFKQQWNIPNIFGVYLGPEKGQVIFGGLDNAHYQGNLEYHDMQPIQYKNTTMHVFNLKTEISINGAKVFRDSYGVIDTGTVHIEIPIKDAADLNAKIGPGTLNKDTGFYMVNCNIISSAPDVILTLGGKPYPLSASDYIIKNTNNGQESCNSAFRGNHNVGTTIGDQTYPALIGNIFIRKYYTVYDNEAFKIGFAQIKH